MTGDVQEGPALLLAARGLGKCYGIYERPLQRMFDLLLPFGPGRAKPFWALRGLDFELRRGDTVGIVGRNGAGKSTLLQLISGTLSPTEGSVYRNARIAALLELGAGFNPEFTGLENVYLNAALYGLSREQADARLERILAFAEIGDFVHQPVKNYSSGMFLRLAFSVIAHVDADVLIVDEALAVGDALFSQKCMRFLREFSERGALLLVSHDLPAINSLCQRALWLDKGQPRMCAGSKEVVEAYLESIYAEQQGIAAVSAARPSAAFTEPGSLPVDMRQSLLVHSNLRNDIELFPFDPGAGGFGTGLAAIEHVAFFDAQGETLNWLVGGERVTLAISYRALVDLERMIAGFLLKDRFGQVLFGDNTYLTYLDEPVSQRAGQLATARFSFRMPYLPPGNYSIAIGIASGTQESHVQHHWMHEALVFQSMGAHVTHGLLGVPMTEISLDFPAEDRAAHA